MSPCPFIPCSAPCLSDEGSPSSCSAPPSCLVLGVSHIHRVSLVLIAPGAVGGTQICHSTDSYPHTRLDLVRNLGRGTGCTRSWAFISLQLQGQDQKQQGQVPGDGSGMFCAVALPAWVSVQGFDNPSVPAAPHWGGRGGVLGHS